VSSGVGSPEPPESGGAGFAGAGAGTGALEAIDRVLNRGGEADDVLRQVVAILHERGGCTYAAIAFVEDDAHVAGPEAGERTDETTGAPVVFEGRRVAELVVAPDDVDRAFLERVATIISAHCR
jgi:hypothetical protein